MSIEKFPTPAKTTVDNAVDNTTDIVVFEERPLADSKAGCIGVLTLNSEKSLNALSLEMIEMIAPKLDAWESDPQIKAVFLQGAGSKAFCAGGDIRKLYEAMKSSGTSKRNPYAEKFFVDEYTLDHKIHSYRKPIMVWGNGIVMGGGLGLMAGAGVRFVTESSMIAMPEISIGLYPDVGASYFLNRMPQGVGLFLGLTATRLNAADALYVGLADFYLPSDRKESLLGFLSQLPWTQSQYENKLLLKESLKGFTSAFTFDGVSNLKLREARFKELAESPDVVTYFKQLSTVVHEDTWFDRAQKNLSQGSPTSARVIFEQIKRGRNLTLNEVFALEGTLTVQFALHHDFQEGIRALIIDKDRPKWQPATLNEVSDALVEEHFTSPWQNGLNPLASLRPLADPKTKESL